MYVRQRMELSQIKTWHPLTIWNYYIRKENKMAPPKTTKWVCHIFRCHASFLLICSFSHNLSPRKPPPWLVLRSYTHKYWSSLDLSSSVVGTINMEENALTSYKGEELRKRKPHKINTWKNKRSHHIHFQGLKISTLVPIEE